MKLETLIKKGIQSKAPRIIIHGQHGIGKSTLGAQAPSPIFIPTEDGLTTIDVDQFPQPQTLADVWEYIGLLVNEEHEYKTVVLDTADWFERLVHVAVCAEAKVTSIEKIGYGKGYTLALSHFETLIRGLEKCREKGMITLLLAHNEIKPFSPPDNDPYDRWQIKLHKSAAARLEEWADAVLMAGFKTFVRKTEKKAVGGERVIYTTPSPAWRAKNRYGFEEELEFNFNAIMEGIKKNG